MWFIFAVALLLVAYYLGYTDGHRHGYALAGNDAVRQVAKHGRSNA